MSITSIQFIGLFVVMMNSGAGLHILLPHFPGTPFAAHTSVIQYSPNQVSSIRWPGVTNCGPNGSLRCAPINVETITFSGASDPSPSDIVGAIPHLRCCCASITDILPKYKDPAATGKLSAHILIEHGVAEAIANMEGRTDTWVTMHSSDPTGITVKANAGTSASSNIVFKPGAKFAIMNTMPDTETTSPHFLAYYLMGVGNNSCSAVPSDGAPCAAGATDCALSKKTSVKAVKPSVNKKRTPVVAIITDIDMNCSNSHWP
jgi:formylmethanofuran dehydrogenase subunit D